MKIVNKPWGQERWFADNGHYLGKVLIINKDQRGSYHYHRQKHETMYIAQGTLHVILEAVSAEIPKGNSIVFLPGQRHSLGSVSEEVVLFEVSTPHPDDSVRVSDIYGRECE
jgi:mannose-6-phosphate isomerase-like protein (cupin superfamily)